MALLRPVMMMLFVTCLALAGCTAPGGPSPTDGSDADLDAGAGADPTGQGFTTPSSQAFSGSWQQVVAYSTGDTRTSTYGYEGDYEADLDNATGAEWTFTVTGSSGVQEWEFCLVDLGSGAHDNDCARGTTQATLSLDNGTASAYGRRVRPAVYVVPADPAPVGVDVAVFIEWEAAVSYR